MDGLQDYPDLQALVPGGGQEPSPTLLPKSLEELVPKEGQQVAALHPELEALIPKPSPMGDLKPVVSDPATPPDFWTAVSSAAKKGLIEGGLEAQAVGEATVRKAQGQEFFAPAQKVEVHSEADELLKQGISEGWSNSKWWGSQIAYGTMKSAPALGLGVAGAVGGTAVGGPIGTLVGGATGFGVGSGVTTLLPAYQRAKAEGLNDSDAIDRALLTSGIAAGFGAAMGIAPGGVMTGTVSKTLADGVVVQALRAPATETLIQIGVVQPTIGVAGHIASEMAQGRKVEDISPDELGTSFAVNVGMGTTIAGPHLALMARGRPSGPPVAPAPKEVVTEAFRSQESPRQQQTLESSKPTIEEFSLTTEPARQEWYYSQVKQVVETKGPNSASGSQWMATISNAPGVKLEEVQQLKLPRYLENAEGKISKADVLAHIEENQLQLVEKIKEDTITQIATMNNTTQYGGQILPGSYLKYGEVLLQLPTKESPRAVKLRQIEGRAVDADDQFRAEYAGRLAEKVETKDNYMGPHYAEPNVLSTFRYTERLDRDAKRTLMVEEIQSDWHQQGRREGYRQDLETPKPRNFKEFLAEKGITDPQEVRRIWNDRSTPENVKLHDEHVIESERRTTGMAENFRKLPDAPFKTSWAELTFKRILRFAADEGYERVAWTNGEQQVSRYAENALSLDQQQGLRNLYNKEIPAIANKWAGKLGMEKGQTELRPGKNTLPIGNNRDLGPLSFVDVGPAAASRIRVGLPLFDEATAHISQVKEYGRNRPTVPGVRESALQTVGILQEFRKSMRISEPLDFQITNLPESSMRGRMSRFENGRYEIMLNVAHLRSPEAVYATAAHEYGHYVMFTKFANLDETSKFAIQEAYVKDRTRMREGGQMKDVFRERDSGIKQFEPRDPAFSEKSILDLTDTQREYWIGFKEWFAEQTAKWSQTSERPLGIVDRFFSSLGKSVRAILQTVSERFGRTFEPAAEMEKWLDSLMQDTPTLGPDEMAQAMMSSQKKNQEAFAREGAPETPATAQTPSTESGRTIIKNLGIKPDDGAGMSAAADRMNKFYEWMISLPQLAKLNPHIRSLQMYKELVSLMHLEKNQMMGEGMETLRQWKGIGNKAQQEALGRFMDDYMNGRFMPEEERKNGLRKPTADEFSKLVADHKLGSDAVKVFQRVVKDFERDLERYRFVLLKETQRIKDPARQAEAMDAINKQIEGMLEKPYMPAMRFGDFTVTVYGADGKVKHFETFESLKQQKRAAEELRGLVAPDDKVLPGQLKKDVRPLLGMPPGLLNLMAEKLQLSESQRQSLDQLKFEYAPAQSFRHRYQSKEFTPGYSDDWQRAFASYKFHGANHFTRTKYADQLRDMIGQVWDERFTRTDATKLDQIRNFMSEHMNQLLDPKPDWAALRGMMFHWYLGFNPAAAAINLSQTPIISYPFLASKFGGIGVGDVRAMRALANASTKLNTYYKQDTLAHVKSGELKALGEAVREGVLTESQGHELAGLSEGRNLLKGFGTPSERAWQGFSEYSAKMFEATEQWNRRVTFRAAWDLALAHPESKYVQEMVAQNALQYQRLRSQGWTHQEASAFTAAKDVVESTQYVYAPYARPKFMWGRKGTLFVFKSFQQNTLFNLMNYPAAAARSLLILGATAGLAGLPFAEDINSLVKGIGARFFGKDWDAEKEVREYVTNVTKGKISPDLLLHGISRYGMGIPFVAEQMGQLAGLDVKLPVIDQSRSLSMGNMLPFDAGKLITPVKDNAGNELRQMQRASGAAFGLGFALYNFLTSRPLEEPDAKKWEQIMPRAMGNAAAAFRLYSEGMERNKTGNAIIRFDPNDTQQMAEIVGKGLGFQPQRLTSRWDNITAKAEAVAYWDIRREVLMRQFWTAYKGQDRESIASVRGAIRKFNEDLPLDAKGKAITSEGLQTSVQNRVQQRALQEGGLPTNLKNLLLYREIDRLYPDGAPSGLVDVKRVR